MHSQSLIDMISSSHCCHNCRNAFAKSIRDLAIFEMLQRWKNIARDQKCEDKISAVLVQDFLESRRWKSKDPTPGYGSYLAKMICVLLVVKSVPRGLHMPRVSGPVQQPQCFMMHIHIETRRHYSRKSSIPQSGGIACLPRQPCIRNAKGSSGSHSEMPHTRAACGVRSERGSRGKRTIRQVRISFGVSLQCKYVYANVSWLVKGCRVRADPQSNVEGHGLALHDGQRSGANVCHLWSRQSVVSREQCHCEASK